jgi:hypothetical protein
MISGMSITKARIYTAMLLMQMVCGVVRAVGGAELSRLELAPSDCIPQLRRSGGSELEPPLQNTSENHHEAGVLEFTAVTDVYLRIPVTITEDITDMPHALPHCLHAEACIPLSIAESFQAFMANSEQRISIVGYPIEELVSRMGQFGVIGSIRIANGRVRGLHVAIKAGRRLHPMPTDPSRDVLIEQAALIVASDANISIDLGHLEVNLPKIPELATTIEPISQGTRYQPAAVTLSMLRSAIDRLPDTCVVRSARSYEGVHPMIILNIPGCDQSIQIEPYPERGIDDIRTILPHILPDQDATTPLGTGIPVNLQLKEILNSLVDAYETTNFHPPRR